MMTKDEALRIAKSLQYEMGLADWTITFTFERDADSYGTCQPAPEYREADINVDLSYEKIDIREVIRHELAHCVLSELATFAATICGDDHRARQMLDMMEDMVCSRIAKMPRFHHGSE